MIQNKNEISDKTDNLIESGMIFHEQVSDAGQNIINPLQKKNEYKKDTININKSVGECTNDLTINGNIPKVYSENDYICFNNNELRLNNDENNDQSNIESYVRPIDTYI